MTKKQAKKDDVPWAIERVTPVCPECGVLLPRPEWSAVGPVTAVCACGQKMHAVFGRQQG